MTAVSNVDQDLMTPASSSFFGVYGTVLQGLMHSFVVGPGFERLIRLV